MGEKQIVEIIAQDIGRFPIANESAFISNHLVRDERLHSGKLVDSRLHRAKTVKGKREYKGSEPTHAGYTYDTLPTGYTWHCATRHPLVDRVD